MALWSEFQALLFQGFPGFLVWLVGIAHIAGPAVVAAGLGAVACRSTLGWIGR